MSEGRTGEEKLRAIHDHCERVGLRLYLHKEGPLYYANVFSSATSSYSMPLYYAKSAPEAIARTADAMGIAQPSSP